MMHTAGMKADHWVDKKISNRDKSMVFLSSYIAMLIVWGLAAIGTHWLPKVEPVAENHLEIVHIEQE
jgi:hypothetical protein